MGYSEKIKCYRCSAVFSVENQESAYCPDCSTRVIATPVHLRSDLEDIAAQAQFKYMLRKRKQERENELR